jgi:hypothetical protein
MSAVRPIWLAMCALALSVAPLFGQGLPGPSNQPPPAPSGPSGPARVTTDTPEYCATLAHRVDHARQIQTGIQTGPSPHAAANGDDVATLAGEGRRMCEHGLVVGGIARLRRAWMLLHPGD